MGFVAVPISSGYPTSGYSSGERVSFCVSDDGAGGQVLVNGLGVTSAVLSGAVDLKTLFGSAAWHSQAVLRAFRAVASQQAAADQFFQNLNIQILVLNGAIGLAGMPSIAPLYGLGSGGATTPYLGIGGPAVAGIWRVDLQLRHTLPG